MSVVPSVRIARGVAPLALAVAATALVGGCGSCLSGQSGEVVAEVGGSRVLPPPGVEGDAADFLVAGLRATTYDADGTGLRATLLGGRTLDASTGGSFLSGGLGGAAWRRLGAGWSVGLEGDAFAFAVEDPFGYRAAGVEGEVAVRWEGDRLRGRLAGTGGVGRSRVTLSTLVQRRRGREEVERILDDDLWRWGGAAELLAGGGSFAAGVTGGVHRGATGTYRSVGVRALSWRAGGAVELRLDVWDTPSGGETTGGVAFHLPWGGWSVRGSAGRPEPDPLVRAEPGRGAGGLLVGRRVVGWAPEDPPGLFHRALERVEGGTRVRFRLPVEAARRVELAGDFTRWDGVAMEEGDGVWTVAWVVPPGVHHFGFLVDGSWYVPEDARDAVPDEWGRRSLTLIVDGEEGS